MPTSLWSPPPGQSVGGALTSAKSAMSTWFSTLAQPAAVTPPTSVEPVTEVKPWWVVRNHSPKYPTETLKWEELVFDDTGELLTQSAVVFLDGYDGCSRGRSRTSVQTPGSWAGGGAEVDALCFCFVFSLSVLHMSGVRFYCPWLSWRKETVFLLERKRIYI